MRVLPRPVLAAALLLAAAACHDPVEPLAPPDDPSEEFLILRPLPVQDFVEITAGNDHTCVRRADGRVYCWGINGLYQTGAWSSDACYSGIDCVAQPLQVTSWTFSTAREIDAGASHTCALDPSGKAFCWGAGGIGQLGIAPGISRTFDLPGPVYGGITFTSISAGQEATCGTSSSGMFCWGRYPGSPNLIEAFAPTNLSPYNGYSRVEVGTRHACAHEIWGNWTYQWVDCWGSNSVGQSGPVAVGQTLPFTVGTGTGWNVRRVATQGDFTCVEQGDGTVQCFGRGWEGQLGNGMFDDNAVPQTVGGGMLLYGVATSRYHACALDAKGNAWCWGKDDKGQLGRGFLGNRWAMSAVPVPVNMPAGVTFRAIAAGDSHSCAIGNDEGIYCWGDNSHGQLGRGTWTPDATPWVPLRTWTPQ